MTDPTAQIEAGLIPFVECRHGEGPEWNPAHYRIGPFTTLVSCVQCLRTFREDQVVWLTPQEASQRYGWNTVASEGSPPAS